MKRKLAFVIMVAVLLPSVGSLQAQSGRTIYGVGTDSCGAWTAARKTANWFDRGQWLLGYVSAVNTWATTPPRKTDAQAMLAWVDNFCQANPLKDTDDAAAALIFELGANFHK